MPFVNNTKNRDQSQFTRLADLIVDNVRRENPSVLLIPFLGWRPIIVLFDLNAVEQGIVLYDAECVFTPAADGITLTITFGNREFRLEFHPGDLPRFNALLIKFRALVPSIHRV
uniref:Uncharacterized protein n=1 Tax=Panagrolaimus sp. JU765 TaxID=591449 RepID=A0AC34R2W8_9BILA